jgi:ABC-2 type transport system permease protein
MRSLYAIYRKEMGHYFVSPIAYVAVGLFLILGGVFFDSDLSQAIDYGLQMQLQGAQFGAPQPFDVPSQVMRAFFSVLAVVFLFFLPMLTMGVYAEERKRGTMELLMTSPITELQIVLGKFLASLTLFAAMLLPTAIYLIYMFLHSDPAPPWRMLLTGYLGVMLFGGALLALGSFISSLTENQIVAGVITFAGFLFLWILEATTHSTGSAMGQVLQYLSVIGHYQDFTQGVIDTSSLIYYGSFIFLFVFLTVRAVDSMRWRRA